jgi:hypothetical protein
MKKSWLVFVVAGVVGMFGSNVRQAKVSKASIIPLAGCGGGGGGTTGGTTGGNTGGTTGGTTGGGGNHSIKTAFVIVMENKNWSDIKASADAVFIKQLLAQGAHAEQYFNPPHLHPSEPNYLWLEAGNNYGLTSDNDASSSNYIANQPHLVAQLGQAGISWKSYQEDIDGTTCPLSSSPSASPQAYAAKHNPFVFFGDLTNNNDPASSACIAHNRPFSELAADLNSGNLARYNFITPNLCNDMHGDAKCGAGYNDIKTGDAWLAKNVPAIVGSEAFKQGGALFIVWDESENPLQLTDSPIGMIVVSPFAKVGYQSSIAYTHSSTLRTLQEIFGVGPFLGDAAKATDLSDLFSTFP